MSDPPDQMAAKPVACAIPHDDGERPAAAVLFADGEFGDGLCASCARCSEPRCEALGTVLDTGHDALWCRAHARDGSSGPTIVPIR
jgi:hypothetical protein